MQSNKRRKTNVTAVRIAEPLRQQLDLQAAARGLTFSDAMRQAVATWVMTCVTEDVQSGMGEGAGGVS